MQLEKVTNYNCTLDNIETETRKVIQMYRAFICRQTLIAIIQQIRHIQTSCGQKTIPLITDRNRKTSNKELSDDNRYSRTVIDFYGQLFVSHSNNVSGLQQTFIFNRRYRQFDSERKMCCSISGIKLLLVSFPTWRQLIIFFDDLDISNFKKLLNEMKVDLLGKRRNEERVYRFPDER